MADISKKAAKKARKREKHLLAKQATTIPQPNSESTARTTTAPSSTATLAFTPTPATNAALANWTVEEIDAKLLSMEEQWSQTKSGPFPVAIRTSMMDLRERVKVRDETRGEKEGDAKVLTLPYNTNGDSSHLLPMAIEGGRSADPVSVITDTCHVKRNEEASVEHTAIHTPIVHIMPTKPIPVVQDERTCIVTVDKPALAFKGDTSTNPDCTTSAEPIAFFCGDQREGEDPQEFLRAFHNDMHACLVSDDKEIANAFVDYLGADSTADHWYHNLPQATRNSWNKLEVAFVQQWPREENEVVNEVYTMAKTPVPFDWATDVDEAVGAVTVAPVALVDHVYAEHVVTFTPMSRAPRDFSALRSSTRNPWASLKHRHRRSHPRVRVPFNSCMNHKTSAPSLPIPIQLVETFRHPHGIAPTKPVIRTTPSTPVVMPPVHPSTPTPSCTPSSRADLDSSLQRLQALSLDWSGDALLAGLARILEALGWTRECVAARTPLCLRGAHGVVGLGGAEPLVD